MNLRNKRVFVSGGAGVIGTALVESLLKEDAFIFVGDLKPRPENWPKEIRYWRGDLNYITSSELMHFNPEVFFHLAATFERSTETYDFWYENFHHNVNLSNHLMTLLKDSNALKKVIFASSYLIYHPEQYYFNEPARSATRLKESDPIYPRNLCGTAKLLHEMELEFLKHFDQNKYDTVSARIFRVYGKNSKDVVSRWIRSLLKGETLTVYKQEGIFDYIYAEDVAKGLLELAINDVNGLVNLGRDNARRVSELLEILKEYFPEMKTIHSDLDIPFEASQANMDLFKSKTGWAPGRNLEDAIPEMIEYEKESENSDYKNPLDPNVLITSISQKVPLIQAIKKALKKTGNNGNVFGADINGDCIGRYFVDRFYQMPELNRLDLNVLVHYCKKNGIKAIIPTRDGELEYFATNKGLLESNGICVMVSEPDAVNTCVDKMKFYERLNNLGYPAIFTSSSVDKILAERIVVKEQFGAGSKKAGIGITRNQVMDISKDMGSPIYQPFISGKEFSVDVYVNKSGKAIGAVVRSRDVVVNGESQITTTCPNKSLEDICSLASEDLRLYGHSVWQVLVDEANRFHIIECNCRFGGASTLSIEAGLDSFYWFLLESTGEDITGFVFPKTARVLKQVRFKADLVI